MMATRKQIAAAEAAQKEFDKELAKTRALASKTTAEVNRLTAPKPSQTPELTETEKRIFGVTGPLGSAVSVGARSTGATGVVNPNATAELLAKQEADRIAEEKRLEEKRIADEAERKEREMELTKDEMVEALEAAKISLEFADDEEKPEIEEYILSLETAIEFA